MTLRCRDCKSPNIIIDRPKGEKAICTNCLWEELRRSKYQAKRWFRKYQNLKKILQSLIKGII